MQAIRRTERVHGGQGKILLPGLRAPRTGTAQGFTLLELLVVVAILAATAFIATGAFYDVNEHVEERVVRAEMQEIAKALRQFKQDTGYYPRQGPFALGAVDDETVTDADLQTVAYSGTTVAARTRWFNSPANFYQLLVGPLLSNHVQGLQEWNPETGRGWRGPYLQGFGDGFVDIGDGLAANGIGDPANITVAAIPDVNGLADPFHGRPLVGGGAAVGDTLFDWSNLARPGRSTNTERSRWGRPYLFVQLASVWSLVSLGPNGEYDNGTDDDIVLPIE